MGGWGEVIGGPKVWARDLSLAVAIGVAIAFLGPFGSYTRPLEQRLLMSISFGLAGSTVMWPFVRLMLWRARLAGVPEWFAIIGALVLATAPVTAMTRLVLVLMYPGRPLPELVGHFLGVMAIVVPIGIPMILFDRRAGTGGEIRPAEPPPAEPARPRLLARLRGRLGTDLLALQAEDHYVRVHTALGSDLILMRLADAIAETDGLDGLRVHRSWWVAKAAVRSARAEGRRAVLVMANGLEVPVTRDSVPEVRRAGWL
jgi:hypothetical protein